MFSFLNILAQTRAQFILGETYVEELRLAIADDVVAEIVPGTGVNVGADGVRVALDPRTMGVETSACGGDLSTEAAGGWVWEFLFFRASFPCENEDFRWQFEGIAACVL